MSLTMEQMQAVHTLYPQAVVIRGDIAYDAEENIVEYDLTAIQAEAAKQEAAKQAAQDSATAKLKKLGLTDDEISALKGTL
jgi:hypothetical protein